MGWEVSLHGWRLFSTCDSSELEQHVVKQNILHILRVSVRMTAPIPLDEERIVSPGIITVSDRHDGLLFLHSSLYQLPASLSGNIVAITKHFVAFLPNMRHEDTIDRYTD